MDHGTGSRRLEMPTKTKNVTLNQRLVLCPIHKQDLKIEIVDGKQIAICRCVVPNDNPWKKQVVWESTQTRRTI